MQESWLRWSGVDRAQVRHPRAYLVRIVTRQALNALRTASRRREDYFLIRNPHKLTRVDEPAELSAR